MLLNEFDDVLAYEVIEPVSGDFDLKYWIFYTFYR